jgi:hypothetical protein
MLSPDDVAGRRQLDRLPGAGAGAGATVVCDLSLDDDNDESDHPSSSSSSSTLLGKRPLPSPSTRSAAAVLMGAAKLKWGPSPSPPPPAAPPSATSVLMANAKLKWSTTNTTATAAATASNNKTVGGAKTKKRGNSVYMDRSGTDGAQKDRFCPAFKKVMQGAHMTKPIIVDGFNYSSAELSDCYFLTHFHSDHYGGLTKHFTHGNIYCSPATCSLVKLKLNVPSRYLHALALDKKHTVMCDGVPVEVTMTDANHCPGSVLILFQFPNSTGGGGGVVKSVLHTGDFRFCSQMLESSRMLRQLASDPARNSKQLVVYLDTTYCDPSHRFPPQQDCIAAVQQCVTDDIAVMATRREHAAVAHGIITPPSSLPPGSSCLQGTGAREADATLYVFGAYGIGESLLAC